MVVDEGHADGGSDQHGSGAGRPARACRALRAGPPPRPTELLGALPHRPRPTPACAPTPEPAVDVDQVPTARRPRRSRRTRSRGAAVTGRVDHRLARDRVGSGARAGRGRRAARTELERNPASAGRRARPARHRARARRAPAAAGCARAVARPAPAARPRPGGRREPRRRRGVPAACCARPAARAAARQPRPDAVVQLAADHAALGQPCAGRRVTGAHEVRVARTSASPTASTGCSWSSASRVVRRAARPAAG